MNKLVRLPVPGQADLPALKDMVDAQEELLARFRCVVGYFGHTWASEKLGVTRPTLTRALDVNRLRRIDNRCRPYLEWLPWILAVDPNGDVAEWVVAQTVRPTSPEESAAAWERVIGELDAESEANMRGRWRRELAARRLGRAA